MKAHLFPVVLFCLCVSLAITFFSIESVADIFARGAAGNVLNIIINGIILLSETVTLIIIHNTLTPFFLKNSCSVE